MPGIMARALLVYTSGGEASRQIILPKMTLINSVYLTVQNTTKAEINHPKPPKLPTLKLANYVKISGRFHSLRC